MAARDAPATRGLRFATPEPSAEGTTATAAARKGDVSAVEKRLSELEEKAEKTFPALAASLAARSRRAEQSDERLGRKAFVFVDPSGERVPLVRHCSLDQRHAKREEAKGDVEGPSPWAPREGVEGFAGSEAFPEAEGLARSEERMLRSGV